MSRGNESISGPLTELTAVEGISCELQEMKVVTSKTAVQKRKKNDAREMQILTMLFSVTVINIVSWIPFWLMMFELFPRIIFFYYMFLLNNCSNAIVYLLVNKQIRKEVKALFCD